MYSEVLQQADIFPGNSKEVAELVAAGRYVPSHFIQSMINMVHYLASINCTEDEINLAISIAFKERKAKKGIYRRDTIYEDVAAL